jgi:SpoIID/LytB domain protein
MFKLRLLLVASLTFSALTPAYAEAAPTSFTFTGSGYGHGVGMSQIGAKARALAGESATSILKYYFKGVEVIPLIDTATIRVNIGHALGSIDIAPSKGSMLAIYSGEVKREDLTTTPQFLTTKKLTFTTDGKNVQSPVSAPVITIRWRDGANPLASVTEGATTDRYKYGQIQIKVVKGALEVTNSLSIHDEYLLGISEISSAWPGATLEAQTIASRSYALSKMGSIKNSCDCHLYAHIADQNFVGYAKESEPKIGSLWRAAVLRTIVDTSTGLALVSQGKPIQAYFFSSSGGATQTTSDAWGGITSYTQSVPDTASVDLKLNPRFATWRASSSQSLVAQAFLLPDVVTLDVVARNSAGAVTWIKGTSSTGKSATLRGDTFRSRAKLPSPWFQLISVQN